MSDSFNKLHYTFLKTILKAIRKKEIVKKKLRAAISLALGRECLPFEARTVEFSGQWSRRPLVRNLNGTWRRPIKHEQFLAFSDNTYQT